MLNLNSFKYILISGDFQFRQFFAIDRDMRREIDFQFGKERKGAYAGFHDPVSFDLGRDFSQKKEDA